MYKVHLAYMISKKAAYISSIHGIIGGPDIPSNHASKAANRVMAKIDALLYAKNKIRMNSVHPGFILTPMVENFLSEQSKKSGMSVEDLRKELDAKH